MTAATRRRPVRRALLAVIRFYSQAISPALPARCRFYPSCSAYAAEAVARHGAARGSWLALRRLAKCAPWHPGGVDLVPAAPPGTPDPDGASSTAADPEPRPTPTAPPAPCRSPQQEAGVA
jgi:putative membrane protein insertion efficiency factor